MLLKRLLLKFLFSVFISCIGITPSILASEPLSYSSNSIFSNKNPKWITVVVHLNELRSPSEGSLGSPSIRIDGNLKKNRLHALGITRATIRTKIPSYLAEPGQPGRFFLDEYQFETGRFRRLVNLLSNADKLKLHALCSYIYKNPTSITSEAKKTKYSKGKEFWSNRNREYEIKKLAGFCLRGMAKKAASLRKVTQQAVISNDYKKCTFKQPLNCGDIVLCQNATTRVFSERIWGLQPYKLPAIEEAKKRGLSCNVGNDYLVQLNLINIRKFHTNQTQVFESLENNNGYRCTKAKSYIRSAQTKLSSLGYYKSSIDGIFGKNTKSAYIAFEDFLGDEIAKVDGCLDDNEVLWLNLIEKAKQQGLECDKPVFGSQEIFSARDFLKKYEYFDGDVPTTQSDKRTFTEGIIRMEAEGKLHGDDFSRNCILDETDVDIILARMDADKNERGDTVQSASNADLPNAGDILIATANLDDEKTCSVENIETCSIKELCENTISTDEQVSSVLLQDNPYYDFLIKKPSNLTILCGYDSVLNSIKIDDLNDFLKGFIALKGNKAFDLELAKLLKPVNELIGTSNVQQSEPYLALLSYLKKNLQFESFVAENIRSKIKKERNDLSQIYLELSEQVKELENWAQENILNPLAADVYTLLQNVSDVDIETVSADILTNLNNKVESLNTAIQGDPVAEEPNNNVQTEKVIEAEPNREEEKEGLTIASFSIAFSKEYGDGFDNFLAPKNYTLAHVNVKFKTSVSNIKEMDATTIQLVSGDGNPIDPNDLATNAYYLQLGQNGVDLRKIKIEKSEIDLVYLVKITSKASNEFKLLFNNSTHKRKN